TAFSQSLSRSSPWASDAVHFMVSPSTKTSASGFALRFKYHDGCLAFPPLDAIRTKLPPSLRYRSGVVLSFPVFAPVVLSRRHGHAKVVFSFPPEAVISHLSTAEPMLIMVHAPALVEPNHASILFIAPSFFVCIGRVIPI